jgi:hypothetical protein
LHALAVVAILFAQFTDCMSAMAPDQQSMQCCGSMPCHQGNQHDCCQATQQVSAVLPAASAALSLSTQFLHAADGWIRPEAVRPTITVSPQLAVSAPSPPASFIENVPVLRI